MSDDVGAENYGGLVVSKDENELDIKKKNKRIYQHVKER